MSKFGSYLKTRQFRVNLLLAAATLVVLVMIVIFGLNIYTRHGTVIPVPQLKGMQIEKAMALLKDQGFEYKIDSVYLDQTPGAVVEQDPDAGTNVKENRTIYLTVVTRLAPPISMPDLEPFTYREAAATLSNF